MSDEIKFEISIPPDDDGFILLKCEHCGTLFKITAADINDDGILNIFCPSCGLISDNYFTDDVIELAVTKVKNYAGDMIYDMFKNLEKHNTNSFIKFKMESKPQHEIENPIHSEIEALEITDFPCCHRTAKVKPLLKMTGCYCPFCGVKEYEFKQN